MNERIAELEDSHRRLAFLVMDNPEKASQMLLKMTRQLVSAVGYALDARNSLLPKVPSTP